MSELNMHPMAAAARERAAIALAERQKEHRLRTAQLNNLLEVASKHEFSVDFIHIKPDSIEGGRHVVVAYHHELDIASIATAVCSPADPFCLVHGKVIALQRLLADSVIRWPVSRDPKQAKDDIHTMFLNF